MSPELTLLLKQVSRSFYLSLRFLPGPVRPGMSVAYLLARASDTLADADALLAQDRLQELDTFLALWGGQTAWGACQEHWGRLAEKLTHPGEKVLLRNVGQAMELAKRLPAAEVAAIDQVLRTIVSGQQLDVSRFPDAAQLRYLPDAPALLDYTYRVAGCVGGFWTDMLALTVPQCLRAPVQTLREQGVQLGQGLQLVNILRDLGEDFRLGRCYLPEAALEKNSSGEPVQASLLQAREYWLGEARRLVDAGNAYTAGLRGIRVRFTADLPRRLAEQTLTAIAENPDPFQKVKVTRQVVRKSAAASLWRALFTSKT